jgi:hypothetical protein
LTPPAEPGEARFEAILGDFIFAQCESDLEPDKSQSDHVTARYGTNRSSPVLSRSAQLMLFVATTAALIPAWRASSIDPSRALHDA